MVSQSVAFKNSLSTCNSCVRYAKIILANRSRALLVAVSRVVGTKPCRKQSPMHALRSR